jgi:hypothetical protein
MEIYPLQSFEELDQSEYDRSQTGGDGKEYASLECDFSIAVDTPNRGREHVLPGYGTNASATMSGL